MSDFSDVLKAVQNKLSEDATVAELISEFIGMPAVFVEKVPKGAKLPYVLIVSITDTPFDTHSSLGEKTYWQISVFARTEYEAKDIFSAISNLLHHNTVETESYVCLHVRRTAGPRHFFETEEEVHHSSGDFEAVVQEI